MKPTGPFSWIVVLLATATLIACSDNHDADPPQSSTTSPANAAPNSPSKAAMPEPAEDATANDHASIESLTGQTLGELMQQRDFVAALKAMDGADQLPDWVAKGGKATPATEVVVDTQKRLMTQACQPHNCPSERIALLYEPDRQTMQGVLASDPAPTADAGISSDTKLRWLGEPEAAVQEWLTRRLKSPSTD